MLWSLLLNIVVPSAVLLGALGSLDLAPAVTLGVAIAFPLGYGLWDLATKRRVNPVSTLGVISVALTGGIGLLELDAGWIAVKEAAIPVLLAAILLLSCLTPWPVLQTLLLDAELLDVARIRARVDERGTQRDLTRLIRWGTAWLALSFLASAAISYALAAVLVRSPPNTPEFNAELGQLTLWSLPAIALPSLIASLVVLWWLLGGLGRLTDLTLDELVAAPARDEGGAG